MTAGLWDTLVWVRDKEERKITAYHEAGHVLVSYFTPDSNPVHKVEIDD